MHKLSQKVDKLTGSEQDKKSMLKIGDYVIINREVVLRGGILIPRYEGGIINRIDDKFITIYCNDYSGYIVDKQYVKRAIMLCA